MLYAAANPAAVPAATAGRVLRTPIDRVRVLVMAAATAASIHAPLTAAVLVFELSGDYPIVLPLLVATLVGTAVSRSLGRLPLMRRRHRIA